jgi:hypothetical protein
MLGKSTRNLSIELFVKCGQPSSRILAFLLEGHDQDSDGPEDDARIAIESLRESCLALQAEGKRTIDSFRPGKLVSKANDKLSRPTPREDDE